MTTLLLLLALTVPAADPPRCRVEQRVVAWSQDGAAALLFQHQTCVAHLPPLSLWLLEPGEGRLGERVEIWRPRAQDPRVRVRADALVSKAGLGMTPIGRDTALPGVLVAHPDPDRRDQGLMGSPLLSDESAFAPYDGDADAAGKRCARSFPCGGLCVYEGHYSPGRRWVVCAPGGLEGAEVDLRYVRILPGEGEGVAPALDLERELGRWNGRVLKQRTALRAGTEGPQVQEIAGILRSQNEDLHRLAAQALAKRTEVEAVEALLDLLEQGSLQELVPGLLSGSPSPALGGALSARLWRLAAAELDLAEGLLSVAAARCEPEIWAAARRFVTMGGLSVELRTRVVEGCDPHVPLEDADFVMALATSEGTPLPLRVAAGRVLGRMRGETPGRLKGKLWRFDPPKEVMDAIKGKR